MVTQNFKRKKNLTLVAYFLHLETPGLPACYSLIPPFSFRRIVLLGKRALCSFHNYFLLLRDVIPKLLRQYILLTLILRFSDAGAPSNSWRMLWHSQEPGQPFVTEKLSDGQKQTPLYSYRCKAEQALNQVKTQSKLKVTICPQLHQSILGLLDVIRSRRGIKYYSS